MKQKQQIVTAGASDITPLQASKWLSLQMLIDDTEMEDLLKSLGEIYFFSVGRVYPRGEGEFFCEDFLQAYRNYITYLKEGKPLPSSHPYFSSALSVSADHFAALAISESEQMIRAVKPIIQLQPHSMGYLENEKSFKPLIFGSNSISWGLQIAYPQLWQNPATKIIEKVKLSQDLPNAKLFRMIQLWSRENTVATPFICEDKVVNVPMRLGLKCFSWINKHPQLKKKKLAVLQR